jgi:tetratricopeptide (TPR) repeat protein
MKKIFLFLMLGLLLNAQASVAQTSSESDYLMRKVYELLNDNNTDEALKYVNQHIENSPKSPEAYFLRGKIYLFKEMYSDALTDMNKAQALWHKKCLIEKYTLAWWKAEIYVNMQMTEKGIEELNLAYKLFKDKNDIETKNEILQRRAQLYYELDDYESADADYRLMLKNNEAEVLAMIGLVRNMMAREDYQGALKMANTCQKYSDTYSEV